MIAFDNSTTKSIFSGMNTTFNHTCTGSNRGLVVFVMHSSNNTVTGVTYNGVSMSGIDAVSPAGVLEGYYLANPASGTNTVVISGNGTQANSTAVALSFTGVHQDQTKMITNSVVFSHSLIDATSSSHAITTKHSDSMVIDCISSDGDIATGSTAGANQTKRSSYAFGFTHASSTESTVSSGVVTMSWTWTNTVRYGTILAEIRPPKKQYIMSY